MTYRKAVLLIIQGEMYMSNGRNHIYMQVYFHKCPREEVINNIRKYVSSSVVLHAYHV